jgi:serine/threonine-protein kinase RsbW
LVEREGRINIELPLEKEYARILRLLVSGIASRMNFNLDAVDDLKIAVEEAFLMARRREVASPLRVSFTLQPDGVRIDFDGAAGLPVGSEQKQDDFGAFILEGVVDKLEKTADDNRFSLSLVKHL